MGYNCVVLIREVLDTRDLVGDVIGQDGNLDTSRMSTRLEPEDMNALEMALQIKDKHGGTVTAISVGVPKEVDALRESLYRGVDHVYRLVDPLLQNCDTAAQATAIATAVRKIQGVDLFLTGLDVVEGENAQVGAQVAKCLGLPRANYVDRLVSVEDGKATCVRAVEGGYETVCLPLPAALIVGVALLKDDPRAPRNAKARLKLQMKKAEIEEWDGATLGLKAGTYEGQTIVVLYEAVPQRTYESRNVDPTDEVALRQMILELKG